MIRSPRTDFLVSLLWPVVGGIVVNLLISTLGWNDGDANASPLLPPPWVIGLVWMVLLLVGGLALARFRARGASRASTFTLLALIACLAYPFYAIAPDAVAAGYAGSAFTVVLLVAAILTGRRADRLAATCLFVITAWIAYANGAMILAR